MTISPPLFDPLSNHVGMEFATTAFFPLPRLDEDGRGPKDLPYSSVSTPEHDSSFRPERSVFRRGVLVSGRRSLFNIYGPAGSLSASTGLPVSNNG